MEDEMRFRCLDFVGRTVAIRHGSRHNSVLLSPENVMGSVSHDEGHSGIKALGFENVGYEIALLGKTAVELAPVNAVEESGEIEMIENTAGEDRRFRRGQKYPEPLRMDVPEGRDDSRIEKVFIDADFGKPFTVMVQSPVQQDVIGATEETRE